MVNHSSKEIAVFNGQPSGTKNTIEYAQHQSISVHQIKGEVYEKDCAYSSHSHHSPISYLRYITGARTRAMQPL